LIWVRPARCLSFAAVVLKEDESHAELAEAICRFLVVAGRTVRTADDAWDRSRKCPETRGASFEGHRGRAKVVTRDKHPNADKLSLCRVNDGKGETPDRLRARTISKRGIKWPLILPGSTLPAKTGRTAARDQGRKDSRSRIPGHAVLAAGTGFCPDEVDGLLILREDAPVGQPFSEYLGRSSWRCGLRS